MSSDLERRCRRVLRLLPGWYRQEWEQDMVAAFLDGWLAGDPEDDEAHRTPGGTDQPAQQDSSLPALPPAGPICLIASQRVEQEKRHYVLSRRWRRVR
jgi:hypothetical protein